MINFSESEAENGKNISHRYNKDRTRSWKQIY